MPLLGLMLAALVVYLIYELIMLVLGVIWYMGGWVFGFGAGVLSWWAVNVPLAVIGIVTAAVIAQIVVRAALNATAKGKLRPNAIQAIAIAMSIIVASLAVVGAERLLVAHGHISPIFQSLRRGAEKSSKLYTPPKPVWKKFTLKNWANNGQACGGSLGVGLGLFSGVVLMAVGTVGGAGVIGFKTHERLALRQAARPVDPQLAQVTNALGVTWLAAAISQSDLAELESGLQRWERARDAMLTVKAEMESFAMSDEIDELQILAQQIFGLNQVFLPKREWQSHAQAFTAAFDEIEQHSPVKTALDALGLSRAELNMVSLKKAYRAAAMQHHPDRGGDAGLFVEAQTAYGQLEEYLDRNGEQSCQKAA